MEQLKTFRLQPSQVCTAGSDSMQLALLVVLEEMSETGAVFPGRSQILIHDHQFQMHSMLSRLESGSHNGIIMNLY